MVAQRPDDGKLRELVLLIATLSEGDKPFGAVKLNKLLFFADFLAYLNFGESITGHEYQRLPQGPAPRRLLAVVPAFAKPPGPDADVAVRVKDYHGYAQNRPLALRAPDTDVFTDSQIALVEGLVAECWGRSARQMSDLSHNFPGWRLAKNGETIPYQVALVSLREPTMEERRIGVELEGCAAACLV